MKYMKNVIKYIKMYLAFRKADATTKADREAMRVHSLGYQDTMYALTGVEPKLLDAAILEVKDKAKHKTLVYQYGVREALKQIKQWGLPCTK